MPILPPKITGDGVEDSWNKSVTDQLNELEVSLQAQLEVTDVQSSNWDGLSSVPSDIVDENVYPDLTSREQVIGTRGFFLDSSSGIITTEDVVIRGDLASANFQVTGGNDGFLMDGDTGRAFMNTTINRGDLVSPAAANRHGGTAFTSINDAQVASLQTNNIEGWAINSGGTAYFDTVYTRNIQASNLTSSGASLTSIFQAANNTNATQINFVSGTAFHDSTSLTPTTLVTNGLVAGGTYTMLITWDTTFNVNNSGFPVTASLMRNFSLVPTGTDLDGSQITAGFGLGDALVSIDDVTYRNDPLGTLTVQYSAGNTNTPSTLHFEETPVRTSPAPAFNYQIAKDTTVTDGTVGIKQIWRHG